MAHLKKLWSCSARARPFVLRGCVELKVFEKFLEGGVAQKKTFGREEKQLLLRRRRRKIFCIKMKPSWKRKNCIFKLS